MFEREIQFIYDFSHNKIKKLGSFVTFGQLRSTDLHPAILQYISAEIDFYIFEDRQKLLKDSLFDYSGSKINSYFMMISEEIKKSKKFSQSYIEKLILHSITFTVNHLVSPNSLTSQFIFEDDKEKNTSEIKQILNYLYYYPHIKKIISSYLDKKNLHKITSEEFSELLKKIDSIGFTENPGKIYSEALESMADFLNVGMSGRGMVPLTAVQSYLKDKNLNVHLDKLQSEFVDPEITRYEIKDYHKLLVGVEPSESKPDDFTETEEVLESDLKEDSVQPNVFEPVEEEETTVDLKIKDGESPKVILDDEPVAESGKEQDERTVKNQDQKMTDVTDESDTGAVSESSDEDNVPAPAEKAAAESPGDKEESKPAMPDDADEEIIEIEDEREVEGETVAEVMEWAKEEKKIAAEEELEGKEPIPEDEDEPLEIIDDLNDENGSLSGGPEDETNTTVDEPAASDEQKEEQDSSVEIKHPLGFQVAEGENKEITGEDSDEGLSEESQNKSDPDISEPAVNDAREQEKEEELPDSASDSKDTLSYLLNDDEIEEAKSDDSKETEQQDNMNDEMISEEELALFEDDRKDESGEKEEKSIEKPDGPKASHIDISSLLENKKITKVIDAIFDYDMEEFANTIELISEAPSLGSANQIIDNVCSASQIPSSSKEVKLFKSIISDYYDPK